MSTPDTTLVRHFRQILLWPVELVLSGEGTSIRQHWEALQQSNGGLWKEIDDEFTGDPRQFQERHYHEFVSFLPHVQRFLYGGELGRTRTDGYGESPMRVFRRTDIARVRVAFDDTPEPIEFEIAHVDLYFFYDLDIALLAVEIYADDLPLALAQETMFRLGRAYPAFWERDGRAGNCPRSVQWLAANGAVLASSDYEQRADYLSYVCEHRAPRLAAHWEYLLHPIASHHLNAGEGIRLRQLEYYRMPLMAYLSLDDPRQLSRADFVRLAFASPPGDSSTLPYSAYSLRDFEPRYCFDRDWHEGADGNAIRYLCCGHAFVVVGPASSAYFTDAENGLLAQFRHALFLLGLIAHVHKAALLMLSERLTIAIGQMEISDAQSVRVFRRSIRQSLETFLRFTHRYWFHEVSDQAHARQLFRMWTEHLGSERLFSEVREEIQDMNQYLEAGSMRRQTNTMVRLTVVTTFGLIGTVATGFLGMNLIAAADQPLANRFVYFLMVLIPAIGLTFYTVHKSARFAEFLEALADERLAPRDKLGALMRVWRREHVAGRPLAPHAAPRSSHRPAYHAAPRPMPHEVPRP